MLQIDTIDRVWIFLVMALTGKRALNQGMFDKVIRMCDDLVAELKQEQQDDNDKKEYCEQQFDLADDKKKSLERAEKDAENAKAKEAIDTLTDEIKTLEKGIKDLDKSVVEATEQRKEENQEFKDLMMADKKAKEILEFAKKRLNKFYNPTLALAQSRQLGESPQLVEVGVHDASGKASPGPPPETWDAYAKKGEESTNVVAMIDALIADLDKEMTEAKADEKNGQEDYETMMSESAAKRTEDSKSLSAKME